MKKNYKIYFYLIGIALALLVIFLVLFNTLLYDYKGVLNNYLTTYYEEDNNNIENINKLIERYKNNTNRTIAINDEINQDINNRLNEYNKAYNNMDELTTSKDKLLNKIDYLLDNLPDNMDVKNRKKILDNLINSLFESKTYYLIGLEGYNNNDFNKAYENFKNVIKQDYYFEDTSEKIDDMFNSEITIIENKVKEELNKINDATNINDKLEIYKNTLNYLNDKKKNVTFDLTKSKSFDNLLNEIQNKLIDVYTEIANNLKNENKYTEAINKLTEGINIINNASLDATKLILLKEEYDKMEPISLTKLNGNIEGTSIKEELAVDDINKDNYAKAITFYKNDNSSISYDLNGEYKSLKMTINIAKDVVNKNKNYGKIRIYADDKKIYDSSDLTTKFKKNDLNLNIKDIKNLKIEYTISSSKSAGESNIFVALLGNPTLEKY